MNTDKITISAGIFLIVDDKILLGHPTNSSWKYTYSIPKGLVDEGENIQTAAIRECKEEVGIDLLKLIPGFDINKCATGIINYIKKNEVVKQVHYFIVRTTLKELELNSDIIPKDMLQLEEVDWAGFLTKEEAREKIFWRQKELLEFLK